MKRIPQMCLVIVISIVYLMGLFVASTDARDPERPLGMPPYGLAIQSDAAGTKLYGVVYIEFSNAVGILSADARIFVRIRLNNMVQAFYAERSAVPIYNEALLQQAIMSAIAPQVLSYFFPGEQGLTATLKNMSEFMEVVGEDNMSSVGYESYINNTYLPWLIDNYRIKGSIPPVSLPPRLCTHVFADIEVAVK